MRLPSHTFLSDAPDVLNPRCVRCACVQARVCFAKLFVPYLPKPMHELIDDPVDMLVSFQENRVIPKRMRWNARIYDLRAVNLVHTAREGQKRVFYFSVSDTTNYFKLKLDPESLEWRLVETYTDG